MAKEGLIRCGHCKNLFNAYQNELTHDDQIATETNDNDAALPIKLLSEEQSIVDDTSIAEPIWEVEKPRSKRQPSLLIYSCLLATVFLAQITYNNVDVLTQNTNLQPAFKRLNNAFGLHIPGYRDLDSIHVIERQLSQHTELDDILSLRLSIKNTAAAEQAFPTINVVLTSHLGEKVAQGRFIKNEYLNPADSNDFLKPMEVKQIHLLFNKPKKEATGFEISFSD